MTTLLALGMILVSAVMHATWNLFSKRSGGGLTYVWLTNSVSLLFMLPLGFYAYWRSGGHLLPLAPARVRSGNLSLVCPLARGSAPLFSSALATVVFAERTTMLGWLGILAIVGGGLTISLKRGFFGTGVDRRALYYGLATGAMIAAYTCSAPALYYLVLIASEELILTPFALRRGGIAVDWRANRAAIIVVGILGPLSYLLILIALAFQPVSYVAPVREVSILVAVVLGGRFLSEGVGARRVLGARVMIAGIVAITLAR